MKEDLKSQDDICDIYSNKICDNCGKCLELSGVDIRAIQIEDIAKNVEENQYLELELAKAMEKLNEEGQIDEENVLDLNYDEEYQLEEYVDAFENVVYLDELGIDENIDLDERTEEIYPGILKIKD